MYHQHSPSVGATYVQYNYHTSASTSPSTSPSPPEPKYAYYTPKQYKSPSTNKDSYRSSSHKKSYSSSKVPGSWYMTADYPSPSCYAKNDDYRAPPLRSSRTYQDHVSSEESLDRTFTYTKARRNSTSAHYYGGGNGGSSQRDNREYYRGDTYYTVSGSSHPQRRASVQSPKQRIIIDTSDEADDSPTYTNIKPRPTIPKDQYYTRSKKADSSSRRTQVHAPGSREDTRRKSAAVPLNSYNSPTPASRRRASTSKPAGASRSPIPRHVEALRSASAADALKHGIPAGYSLKNWDPDEAPVTLLGSVFDANSLGKWIYDWTVFHHGPSTPMSEVAGDLWLLLIKLAHKMKRADHCLPSVRDYDSAEMVEDFLQSGDRLWIRFKKLLKQCEEFMWKAAKKDGSKSSSIKMGKNSGCEFVDSIFGRDRKLEETESLMQSIRLWSMRFDANCEDILRHPSA